MLRRVASLVVAVAAVATLVAGPAKPAAALTAPKAFGVYPCSVKVGFNLDRSGAWAQIISPTNTCAKVSIQVMNYQCSIWSGIRTAFWPPWGYFMGVRLSTPVWFVWVFIRSKTGVTKDWSMDISGHIY